MAVLLAHDAKVPIEYINIIKSVRTALNAERLDDRRNQAIHGVHSDTKIPNAVKFTMPRWQEPRRTEVVTTDNLMQLGNRLIELQGEISIALNEIAKWKIRIAENRVKHAERKLAEASTPKFVKIAKRFYARTKSFVGN